MQAFRQIRAALTDLIPIEHAASALAVTDLFHRELDEYAELIVGPGGAPAGVMTRGDDASFSERCRTALELCGMPAAAIEHQRALATWFENKRAFFKVEWHAASEGTIEPAAACYFRRRPEVDEVLDKLGGMGVTPAVRDHVRRVAETVDKTTFHFVAAAFRPGQPIQHKLYFSQFVPADLRAQVAQRLERVFDLYGLDGPAREQWRRHHARCVPGGEPTIFVSIRCTGDEVAPTFKIDYPDVPPALASLWLDGEGRTSVLRDAGLACDLAGANRLTFLGVRFTRGEDGPALKYYADVPTAD